MNEETEIETCEVCGRTEDQNELTAEDKRNNLTERDITLTHCRECGASVCGFCADLNVCH